jgi:transposase
MGRSDLERLSKEELIDLVLRLQWPEKTSRTSSRLPLTDRKEQRERAKPGGAKPGHEGRAGSSATRPMRWSITVLADAPAVQPC